MEVEETSEYVMHVICGIGCVIVCCGTCDVILSQSVCIITASY